MAKKQKNKKEEEFEEDYQEEPNNDDDLSIDYDEDEDESIDGEEDIIDSSLEIGGQIHTQSDIVTKFPHLPKDVKYSNFGKIDIANYMLKSNAYQLWQYVKKIQRISKLEIEEIKEQKKQIYEIETPQDLKDYLEVNHKGHIWHNLINNFTTEEFEEKFNVLLTQLQQVKDDGVIEYMYGNKDVFYDSYNSYIEGKKLSDDIDDFGLVNGMMSLTEVNKARRGWATGMMNTTINVTRDENLDKDVEESPEDSERAGFNKYIKK